MERSGVKTGSGRGISPSVPPQKSEKFTEAPPASPPFDSRKKTQNSQELTLPRPFFWSTDYSDCCPCQPSTGNCQPSFPSAHFKKINTITPMIIGLLIILTKFILLLIVLP